MKTLIVYSSKHGTAKKCARLLSDHLDGTIDLFDLGKGPVPEPEGYDRVIVGGSIYVGKIQKEVAGFCSKYLDKLKTKKLGLYICCMFKADAQSQLDNAFPAELRKGAAVSDSFGGELIFSDMSFAERTMTKMVKRVMVQKYPELAGMDMNKDISMLSYEKIAQFAAKLS